MYTKESPVEIRTPTHWTCLAAGDITRHLCQRPAVFFHHLRLVTLSFLQGKLGARLKKSYYFFLIFKKMRKADSA
jgi:hypothetical protein